LTSDAPSEVPGKSTALFFVDTLEVGLKPHDQNGRELPIVPDLPTTHESAGVQYVEASKGDGESANPGRDNLRDRTGGVEVGFISA
jgi:hypothetical protein